MSDINLDMLLDRVVAMVEATVVVDAENRPVQIISQKANDYFVQLAEKPLDELIAQPLELPSFNLLEQLRGDIPPQTFWQPNERQYKVFWRREGNQLVLGLVDISTEIRVHSHSKVVFQDKGTEADAQFLRILYASEDAMLLIENGVFVECNEAVAHFLGYKSKAEFLMQPPAALSPEYQPCGTTSAQKAEYMNAEAIRKGYHRFEWIHLRADGSPIPVEVSLNSIVYQGRSMLHCVWRDLTEQKRMEQELRDQQERMMMELSAPITRLWKNILLLPLVGGMTIQRAQKIISAALASIAQHQAKVFIIDINGVDVVDSSTAHSLIKLAKAAQLMGCAAILSGIRPVIAQTIVEQALDVSALRTCSTLEDALGQALDMTAQREAVI